MVYDFRSDTVTKPTPGMRDAMYRAEVGDDVHREDPTINKLENKVAELFDMEAGLYVSSGTQGNLTALLSHCQRGDEYIVGQIAHTYKYEGGGAAVLGSIQPQPLDLSDDGTIDLEKARKVIKPDDEHYAITRLLCLENTQFGKALPMSYLEEAGQFVRDHSLSLHLDGARVFNAAVKWGVDVSEVTRQFDSVSACFSKGLGAPVGSMVCGSRDFIAECLRWRKLLGGGMRQAGIVAAAALYAVENHVERLAEDHENAEYLAGKLQEVDEIEIDFHENQTNMVFVKISDDECEKLCKFLHSRGILIEAGSPLRLVAHLDVDRGAVDVLVTEIKKYFANNQ